jgi:hypothetical protein
LGGIERASKPRDLFRQLRRVPRAPQREQGAHQGSFPDELRGGATGVFRGALNEHQRVAWKSDGRCPKPHIAPIYLVLEKNVPGPAEIARTRYALVASPRGSV